MELEFKLSLVVLFIFAISLSCKIAYSQSNEKPCSYPEASQLDFWVGSWDLSWKDPDGEMRSGSNVVNKILGGCVIEENFTAGDNSLIGKSYSVYSPKKLMWQQTWIDNSGAYMDFNGGMDGDRMILSRKGINSKGVEIMQRMIFYEITVNSFYWNWENSTDNGTTWNLIWKIKYTRKS